MQVDFLAWEHGLHIRLHDLVALQTGLEIGLSLDHVEDAEQRHAKAADLDDDDKVSPTYRGQICQGSTYFIAADDKKWVPANELQAEAIEIFLSPDHQGLKVQLGDGKGYFMFKSIGSGQSDNRYAIQDRTSPHVFREILKIAQGGYVGPGADRFEKTRPQKSLQNMYGFDVT